MTAKNKYSSGLYAAPEGADSPPGENAPARGGSPVGRFFRSAWSMYYDGFRSMTVGKTLWAIIFIKLFLFFVVMKLLFFPNVLKRDFNTDEQRADHVRHELIDPR